MAHVVHSINITASGLCHHLDSAIDDEHHQYAIDLTLSADALILGRNTFDLFMDFWPDAINQHELPKSTLGLANALNDTVKLVVSSRPVDLTWKNTKHIRGPELGELKQELKKLEGTAVIFGSPSLASSLINEQLVDELHILVQPFIGAEGPRAFGSLRKRVNLSLLSVDSFASGSALLRYAVT